MNDCGKCHATTAPTKQGVSAWSVAATFGHEKHAKDPRAAGKATSCIECHAGVEKSTTLSNVVKPKMQSCDGCHNGKTSFKSTGFECSKCHTTQKQPSTPTVQQGSTSNGSQASLGAPRSRGL
jgi:c(7)-type cytochrome triheme protein